VFGTDAIKHLFTFYHFCRTCQHFPSLICSMLGISGAHCDHINSFSHLCWIRHQFMLLLLNTSNVTSLCSLCWIRQQFMLHMENKSSVFATYTVYVAYVAYAEYIVSFCYWITFLFQHHHHVRSDNVLIFVNMDIK
jgi:hypothetical protein